MSIWWKHILPYLQTDEVILGGNVLLHFQEGGEREANTVFTLQFIFMRSSTQIEMQTLQGVGRKTGQRAFCEARVQSVKGGLFKSGLPTLLTSYVCLFLFLPSQLVVNSVHPFLKQGNSSHPATGKAKKTKLKSKVNCLWGPRERLCPTVSLRDHRFRGPSLSPSQLTYYDNFPCIKGRGRV